MTPHRRVNTIACDEEISLRCPPWFATVGISELRDRLIRRLINRHTFHAGVNTVAQGFAGGLIETHMQLAPVYTAFRRVVACKPAPRFTVNQLAEAIVKPALPVFDSERFNLVADTQESKLSCGVGQQCYSDAEFSNFRCGFKNIAFDISAMALECEGHPNNTRHR